MYMNHDRGRMRRAAALVPDRVRHRHKASPDIVQGRALKLPDFHVSTNDGVALSIITSSSHASPSRKGGGSSLPSAASGTPPGFLARTHEMTCLPPDTKAPPWAQAPVALPWESFNLSVDGHFLTGLSTTVDGACA